MPTRTLLLLSASLAVVPGVAVAQSGTQAAQPQGQAPAVQPNAAPDAQSQSSAAIPSATAGGSLDGGPPRSPSTGVQDIVVTATRRSANLQTVPATVTAFQANTLTSLGVRTVGDVQNVVPGLVVNRLGEGINLYLRGVGTTSAGYTTEPPVAVYIDGFYLPNPGSSVFSFNNIERIEVLKGPQGTLYGRNTTGGLINVITRDPASRPALDASLSYGNYDTFAQNLYGSAPLTDNLAVNVAITHTKQADGWGRNLFTGNQNLTLEETGVQAKLRWEPTNGTKVTLRGMYVHVDTDQGDVEAIYPGAVGTDGTPYLGRYRNADRRDGRVVSTLYNVGLKIEQDIGFANLQSLTGYLDSKGTSQVNTRAEPGNLIPSQTSVYANFPGSSKTFSQEIQISSKKSETSRIEWIGGFFYFHDNATAASETFGSCAGTVCSPAPIPTRTVGFPLTRSYSGYAEGTYKVTARTRLTLGLRYTSDEKSLTGYVEPLPGLPNSPSALPASTVLHPGDPYPGNAAGIATSVTFSKLTYKAVLAQDLSDEIHAYASYNRGFKSGGYSPTAFNNQPSRPEILDAFEVGAKSDLFNRLMRVNLSAFYYDYKDIQVRTTAPPAAPGTSILFNAAAAHTKGVDADINIVPSKSLSITGSLEYLDARYVSFANATCTRPQMIGGAILGGNASYACDNSGHNLPEAPHFSYTLGAVYTIPSSVGTFALAANDSYKSRFFWDPNNRLSQSPYHIVGASLTWTSAQRRYDVQLFVRNLTKTYYFISGTESSIDGYSPGAPRTFGVIAGLHF